VATVRPGLPLRLMQNAFSPVSALTASVLLLLGAAASWGPQRYTAPGTMAQPNPASTAAAPHDMSVIAEHSVPGGGRILGVRRGGRAVSFADAIVMLQSDPGFVAALSSEIAQAVPERAVFFECAPVSRHTASGSPFRCAVLPAEQLDGVEPDPVTFSEHFSKDDGSGVVAFPNSGGDAMLVSPVPARDRPYSHLTTFLATAPTTQREHFWGAVGRALDAQLQATADSDSPVWLSTSGLGVFWLHARLDSRPKYYNYGPFKHWPPQT